MKRQHFNIVVLGMIGAGAWCHSAHAGSLVVTTNNGTQNNTTALTGFQTTGAQMDGMVVTAFFADGLQETAIWTDTGAVSGAASGTRFKLSESGDTFSSLWTLENVSSFGLTELRIDAGPGDTVYDTNWPGEGTPGSANGRSFEYSGNIALVPWDIRAEYRDVVALGAGAPVGDLFRRLNVQFVNSGGLHSNRSIQYFTDTDNLRFAGDIAPVPVPPAVFAGSALLAASGLVSAARRRAHGE